MRVFVKSSISNKVVSVFMSMLLATMMFATPAYAADDTSLAAGVMAQDVEKTFVRVEGTNYLVSGDEGSCSYDSEKQVVVITGDVSVKTDGQAKQGMVVASNAVVELCGVDISPETNGAAITIEADVQATLRLAADSVNTVQGKGKYAGVAVSWENGQKYAHLSIEGEGALEAIGGESGAGVGGSKGANGVHGDITINSGTVIATGNGRSAGIGSSDNPNDGASFGSYKHTEEQWGTITINGGNIKALGNGNGAGIGGGNHTSSGKIIINDGAVHAEGDSGIGAGLGSSGGADKGPGYYYADVTINGGTVTAYATNNMGAGIGGGMYSDAKVLITGGEVTASVSLSGKAYQGGAGIGGGYQGAAIVEITGGKVNATGGNGSPGIGNGALATATCSKNFSDGKWDGTKNVRTGKPTIEAEKSIVKISGGEVLAQGGYGAAGIGAGNCSDSATIMITGGLVIARGYGSTKEEMLGGAGIGSGDAYVPSKMAYKKETSDLSITITGGDVIAIGGWGASGIGSGAENASAASISIDTTNANVQAYADGAKAAIDTITFSENGEPNPITVNADGKLNNTLVGNVMQGIFVFKYKNDEGDMVETEGLNSIYIINEETGFQTHLDLMPEGYRAYASSVPEEGVYAVYSDKVNADSKGRFFAQSDTPVWEGSGTQKAVEYRVVSNRFSENMYLYPVKSVLVEKEVLASDDVAEGEAEEFLGEINDTFYFALCKRVDANTKGAELLQKDGEPWIKKITVENGKAVNGAFFIGIEEGMYDVWEVSEDGTPLDTGDNGIEFDGKLLKKIRTATDINTLKDSGDATKTSNNAAIGYDTVNHITVWLDTVTVRNTFGPMKTEEVTPQSEDPETEEPPASDPDNPDADDPADDPTDDPADDPTDDPSDKPTSEDPQKEDPAPVIPSTEPSDPANPGTDDPTNPAAEDPTDPGTEHPGTDDPANPGSDDLVNQDADDPADDTPQELDSQASNTTSRSTTRTPAQATNANAPAPTPVSPVAAALAAPAAVAEAIADALNPLDSGAEPTTIEDDGNPLAADLDCWVHWYIILGILVTAVYSICVIVRRSNNSHSLKKLDKDQMNREETQEENADSAPVYTPQPSLG